jgi:hypothetical protein
VRGEEEMQTEEQNSVTQIQDIQEIANKPVIKADDVGFDVQKKNKYSIDENNGYICYTVSIQDDLDKIEELRNFVKGIYKNNQYEGFSDFVDIYFDLNSIYFFVENSEGVLLSTQRVVFKTINSLLPCEMAIIDKEPKRRYVIEELDVAELTSFTFNDFKSTNLLITSIIHYLEKNKIRKGYALLDKNSKSIYKVYKQVGWKNSKVYNDQVYFCSYGKKLNNSFFPTLWQLLEITHADINNKKFNYSNYKFYQGS